MRTIAFCVCLIICTLFVTDSWDHAETEATERARIEHQGRNPFLFEMGTLVIPPTDMTAPSTPVDPKRGLKWEQQWEQEWEHDSSPSTRGDEAQ